MKLATIVGARPQFIKAAVLSRLIRETSDVDECLVHTGQHYDERMSDVFFRELDLPEPGHRLGVGSAPHAVQTGRMLIELERVLDFESPDVVLVYGDTNSTLAGALAAAQRGIPVAHVEAGLRSFDRTMPEETNRVLTDHMARWLFCPTDAAVANLEREGITEGVERTGDVMLDAIRFYDDSESPTPTLDACGIGEEPFVLATVHRAANTDESNRFRGILSALVQLAEEVPVVFPLHPRTSRVLEEFGAKLPSGLHAVEPVGYREMLALERRAALVVTDSGGVQKEAFLQGTPCVTLRETTEWTETLEGGWNVLAGCDPERIRLAARKAIQKPPPDRPPQPYGDGTAGERILGILRAA